jgi:hypothetical protein
MRSFEIIGILVVAFIIYRGVYEIVARTLRAQAALRKAEQQKEESHHEQS